MERISQLEPGDEVLIRFKRKTALEVYESEDLTLDNPVEKIFEEGEEILIGIAEADEVKIGAELGSGIAFILPDSVEIISINP